MIRYDDIACGWTAAPRRLLGTVLLALLPATPGLTGWARATATAVAGARLSTPYVGVTMIERRETSPRRANMHIAQIDTGAKGIRFKVTPPGGAREVIRQTTLGFHGLRAVSRSPRADSLHR